jgi:hypothetical protein
METFLSILLGIGLSAACGFRVFVPPLIISIAAMSGHLTLSPGFAWMGTWLALTAFAVATALEIGAYYIPWLDNLLDSIATPAAIVAGIVVSGSMITGMSPFLKWSLAIIAGGGAAALVQGTTVATRAASTALTGGIANPLVSTLELGASVLASVMAILVPLLAILLLVGAGAVAWKLLSRMRPEPVKVAP